MATEKPANSDDDSIWIQSTRGPDDEPVCELTWGRSGSQ